MKTFYIAFFLIVFIACNDHELDNNTEFLCKAIVVAKEDVNCGECIIEFISYPDGLDSLCNKAIAGNRHLYLAINIAESLKVPGTKIKLNIRALQRDELRQCKTFGINYPEVFVIDGIKAE